jgi:hypothetical protein
LFYPCWIGIAFGQDLVFGLACFVIGFDHIRKGKLTLGGFLVSLVLYKYHLFLLLGLGLLLRRNWAVAKGFFGGALLQVVATFCIVGVNGPASYWSLMRNHQAPGMNMTLPVMPNLRDLSINLGLTTSGAQYVLIAMILASALYIIFREVEDSVVATTSIAAMILCAPHCFVHDLTFLLPGLALMLSNSTATPSADLPGTPVRRSRLDLALKATALLLVVPFVFLVQLAVPPPMHALVPMLLVCLIGLTAWRCRQKSIMSADLRVSA